MYTPDQMDGWVDVTLPNLHNCKLVMQDMGIYSPKLCPLIEYCKSMLEKEPMGMCVSHSLSKQPSLFPATNNPLPAKLTGLEGPLLALFVNSHFPCRCILSISISDRLLNSPWNHCVQLVLHLQTQMAVDVPPPPHPAKKLAQTCLKQCKLYKCINKQTVPYFHREVPLIFRL